MVDIITAAIGAKMASASVQGQIDRALTSVYKYKGQCTNAQLSSKTKTAGDVWEITDDGTFAQGTDVVCDGTNWSAMAGQLHVNVVDNLMTQSSTDALSANMGYALATGKQDVLTAGTGITINAQNVISASGSGGTWTKRTANTDWSDIFEVVNNQVVPKKDLLIANGNNLLYYAMKGQGNTIGCYELVYNANGCDNTTTNVYKFYKNIHIMITSSSLSSSNTGFGYYYDTLEVTLDQGSISSVSTGTVFASGNYIKRNLDVYTKE